MEDIIKIQKSEGYLVGRDSITDFVGKTKKLVFDEGIPIQISEQEYKKLKKFENNWFFVIKENTENGN